jgi:hypothetical protein
MTLEGTLGDANTVPTLRACISVRTAAEAEGVAHSLVVFVKPCIHCPAEQTTVELTATGAAQATERKGKMTSKVDSIFGISSNGRQMDASKERYGRERTSARAALGEEYERAMSSVRSCFAFLYGRQRRCCCNERTKETSAVRHFLLRTQYRMYAQNKTDSCILAAILLFHSMFQAFKHISNVVILQYGKHGDNLSDSMRTPSRVLVQLGPEPPHTGTALRHTRWQTRRGKRTNGLHFDAFRDTLRPVYLYSSFPDRVFLLRSTQPHNTSSKRKR